MYCHGMYVITATATRSDTGELLPQVRCGCGAGITSWETAPVEAPVALFLCATCPQCNAKTNIRFTEAAPGSWTVEYSAQEHGVPSACREDA